MRRSAAAFVVALLGSTFFTATPVSAGGFCTEGPLTDRSATTVRMSGNCFSPTIVRIRPGSRVTFVNTDPEHHTVGGAAGSFGEPHGEIVPGESVTYSFDDAGIYPYYCVLHPGMVGAVVVGDGASALAAGPVAPPPSAGGGGGSGPLLGGLLGMAAAGGVGLWLARRRPARGAEVRPIP